MYFIPQSFLHMRWRKIFQGTCYIYRCIETLGERPHRGPKALYKPFLQGTTNFNSSEFLLRIKQHEKCSYKPCHFSVKCLHKSSGLKKPHKNSHTRYNSSLDFCEDFKSFLTIPESPSSEALGLLKWQGGQRCFFLLRYSHFRIFFQVFLKDRLKLLLICRLLFSLQGCFCY